MGMSDALSDGMDGCFYDRKGKTSDYGMDIRHNSYIGEETARRSW